MTILKEVREAILTKEQTAAGIYLEEDEDFLYLFDRSRKRRGVFASKGATFEAIRIAAKKILEEAPL